MCPPEVSLLPNHRPAPFDTAARARGGGAANLFRLEDREWRLAPYNTIVQYPDHFAWRTASVLHVLHVLQRVARPAAREVRVASSPAGEEVGGWRNLGGAGGFHDCTTNTQHARAHTQTDPRAHAARAHTYTHTYAHAHARTRTHAPPTFLRYLP